ncbi:RNA dependent RNA polymerase domain containing protein, partial [Naviculisporaceae sp. PSN 640]
MPTQDRVGAPANVILPPGFESWRSIFVTIAGLPSFTTPLHIRDNFCGYGNISYIEIDEDRANGPRKAMLRFEPPPKDMTPFQGDCRLVINGGYYRARVWYKESFPNDGKFTTPLGNPCPSSVALNPTKVTFGVLTEPTKAIAMESVSSEGPEYPLTFTVDFKKRKMFLAFPVRFVNDYISEYRVDIKFDAIKDIHQVDSESRRPAVIITLLDTPPIWRRRANVRRSFVEGRMRWDQNDLWQRAVHIGPNPKEQDSLPISLDDHSQVIDLGRWTTYHVELDKSLMPVWAEIETNLRDWNIKTKTDDALTMTMATQGKRAHVWAMLGDNILANSGTVGEELALVEEGGIHTSLQFDVRYQLEVCISHGIINEYNIGQDFIEKLIELSRPDRLDPERGRLVLEYAADQGKRIWRPMELFSDPAAMTYFPTTMIIPEYCALMRKVIVTPTRIYFKTPTVETTNRVIRQFRHVKDNFIRLQFTDELLEGRVNGCEESRYDEIYSRAHRVLKQGIQMGPWHWKFLAFGNSQIRENGAFFLCESQTEGARVTCAEVRKWMGSFDHIKTVGKYAARMGQCFSTSRLVPGIMAPTIVKIPDIEHNGYCFTDGVGKMSPLLAEMIAKDWDLEEVPSAVQFRMGGCKGVLVTWPDIKGTEVHVRKSQEKFEAIFNGLEVIRCSQFSVATLNRQTITILESLGVPDHVFTGMMADQVSGYNKAMTDRDLAIKLLEQCVDENQTTLTIAKMVLNGFMESREPFVQTLLQLWRSWSIKSLKEKARLTVNQGAFVLGCVDETGTLKGHSKRLENQTDIDIQDLPQIFLTVPKAPEADDPRNYKVITGLCVVGRNPSLHPGDIRVVNAVDVPALRHLKPGVVAFPRNGDRDIPSMCSGGDLDGDDFFVIWDQNLIPREWCYPPMDYKAPPPHLEKGNIAMDELMAVFFVLYMKNNNLPLIAHAHLATADREAEGAKHPKCIRLAELHSTAVDYVKTAVQAEWSRDFEPRRWPHFMEKPKSYASRKALGQLYDMVKAEKYELKDNYDLPFDSRILNKFQLTDDLLQKARKLKTKYDISMRRIMGQLEIASEHEVWTTFVLSRPRVGTTYKLQEKVGRESAALKKIFRDLCIQEAGGSRDYNVLAPFVAAMYRVTWEELQIAQFETRQPYIAPDGTVKQRKLSERSRPLISFPWLFDTTLGDIATGGDPTLRMHIHTNQKGKNKQTKTKTQGQGQGPVSVLEEQTEDLSMGITRTDDGHVIHRGEILQLFRHEEDEE